MMLHEWPNEDALQKLTMKANMVASLILGRKRQIEEKVKVVDELSASVSEVLTQKQHTMAPLESWHSRMQAASSNRQNTAIVMFTIVTVIFAPLSFMSSVFGMNASEFGDNAWSLSGQFRLREKKSPYHSP
ncbi:hypothetical protein B0H63DRAFT_530958 [Podospora didyma]|uniref:Uncharacterized protein n=1 Tax=Podospora didyma TaxID=330526 RepID=A0AAE0P4I8_9PEZI|nr:hypothetical protein B0H63DRAFT_530958 [Podospora didyma]